VATLANRTDPTGLYDCCNITDVEWGWTGWTIYLNYDDTAQLAAGIKDAGVITGFLAGIPGAAAAALVAGGGIFTLGVIVEQANEWRDQGIVLEIPYFASIGDYYVEPQGGWF
jgi:hypothetical protein